MKDRFEKFVKWFAVMMCLLVYAAIMGAICFLAWKLFFGAWWFFGPETFWQRLACVVLVMLPLLSGLVTGVISAAIGGIGIAGGLIAALLED